MKEITINAYGEYCDLISLYDRDNNLPRKNLDGTLRAFYRGQADSTWKIEPSIVRNNKNEYRLIEEYEKDINQSLFQLMARFQHYYTGTRMIDFTLSSDVALYFACEDEERDGAVFVQSFTPHKEEWYTVKILMEISKCKEEIIEVRKLSEILRVNYPIFDQRFQDIGEIDNAITALISNSYGIMIIPNKETIETNQRIKAQEGCLWICGNRLIKSPNQICTSLTSRYMKIKKGKDDYLVPKALRNHHTLLKIIIPCEVKQQIHEILKEKGITKDFLFPKENI